MRNEGYLDTGEERGSVKGNIERQRTNDRTWTERKTRGKQLEATCTSAETNKNRNKETSLLLNNHSTK